MRPSLGIIAIVTSMVAVACDDAETADYDASVPMRCAERVTVQSERCAATTADCLKGCTREDLDCQAACIEVDPTPDACTQCLDVNELACYLEHDCLRQWDALACCPSYATCTEEDDFAACVESMCTREWELFRSCSSFVDPAECEPGVRMCFRE